MPPLTAHAQEAFRRGLRRATPSVKEVAAEMSVGWSTLELYLNRARPSQAMAARLRHWLERHAKELLEIAAKLPKEDTKR